MLRLTLGTKADGERRWRVLERETNWEQIDLIPSPILAPCPPWRFQVLPSPSDDSKFVFSIPKIFKHTQFFNYTQNVFGILKSGILLHKLDYLSILKTF